MLSKTAELLKSLFVACHIRDFPAVRLDSSPLFAYISLLSCTRMALEFAYSHTASALVNI